MPAVPTGGAPVRLFLLACLGACVALLAGALGGVAAAAPTHTTRHRTSGHVRKAVKDASAGLGQLSGLLPSNKLTVESAQQVALGKETARLPLYPGKATDGTKVWYLLLNASDAGLAHDLG